MTSTSSSYPTCEIPSVNLKPFFEDNKGVVIGEDPTEDQLRVAATINKVCQEHGFVHVTNFGMSKEQGQKLFQAVEELFENPRKHKDYSPWSPETNTGFSPYRYESLNKNRPADLKEAFNIRLPPVWENPSLPHTPESFQNIVDDYNTVMQTAAVRYGMICALALDLPLDFFNKRLKTFDLCTARFLHYPPCDFDHVTPDSDSYKAAADVPIRVGEHTDYGAYTFLLLRGNQGPMGLQVKPGQRGGEIGGSAGGEEQGWMDVKIANKSSGEDGDNKNGEEEGAFGAIINTGSMMARMTNDYWTATPHRVIVPSAELAAKHRYSIPFFVDPDARELIEVSEKYRNWWCNNGENDERKSDVYDQPITSKDFVLMKLRSQDEAVPKA